MSNSSRSSGQAANFHVIAFSNDDRMESLADKFPDGAMGEVNERAGRFDDAQTARANAVQRMFRSAMRRNHDGFSLDCGRINFGADAARAQLSEDGFIVNQFAQDGQADGGWIRPAPGKWRRGRQSTCRDGRRG